MEVYIRSIMINERLNSIFNNQFELVGNYLDFKLKDLVLVENQDQTKIFLVKNGPMMINLKILNEFFNSKKNGFYHFMDLVQKHNLKIFLKKKNNLRC